MRERGKEISEKSKVIITKQKQKAATPLSELIKRNTLKSDIPS